MNHASVPFITPEEWQALQAGPSRSAQDDIDVWFPLRVWFLLIITSVFVAALLLFAPQMSVYQGREPVLVEMLTRFLHFRGLFVVVSTLVGAWAYLVIWDNRCTVHRGTDYDERRYKRDMRRATVSDVGNTVELSSSH